MVLAYSRIVSVVTIIFVSITEILFKVVVKCNIQTSGKIDKFIPPFFKLFEAKLR